MRLSNFDCLTCYNDIIRVPTKTTTDTEGGPTHATCETRSVMIVENEEEGEGGRIALHGQPGPYWENTFVTTADDVTN